jgi:hypothetical protein
VEDKAEKYEILNGNGSFLGDWLKIGAGTAMHDAQSA